MTLYALPPTHLAVPATGTQSVPNQTVVTEAPAVAQAVSVTPVATRTDLLVGSADWSWQELRDYVVSKIEECSGPFPRDARKEYGIFSRFLKEYGQDGIRVAKFAFEVCGGWWNNAPISINRFSRGSDPYFVAPILDRLRDGA